MKQRHDFKKKHKHGHLGKTRQHVFEERVDGAAKIGTYATSVALLEIEEQVYEKQTRQPSNDTSAASKQKIHLGVRPFALCAGRPAI